MGAGGTITQGLGDMDAADRLGAVEVGQRARHLEHPVIAADRELYSVRRIDELPQEVGINTSLTLFGDKLVTVAADGISGGPRDAEPDATNKRNRDRT